ncbi:hypothetical protein [Ornithobacterium rhinotracheale]|uniref:hypothetical protein n=1 Tax=Ornithobacterium rhinotracheale TaxID=28251 RepID=UPI001FF257D3|nr:hypothetical protein [Ornithobacterium rhinotracheale]MCK0204351.1 hypothetical protein [Ornithobacterium rhinotracheale]
MKFLSDLTNVLKLLGVALVALIIWMAFKGFQKTVLLGKDGIPDKISEAFRQKTSKEQFRVYLIIIGRCVLNGSFLEVIQA